VYVLVAILEAYRFITGTPGLAGRRVLQWLAAKALLPAAATPHFRYAPAAAADF